MYDLRKIDDCRAYLEFVEKSFQVQLGPTTKLAFRHGQTGQHKNIEDFTEQELMDVALDIAMKWKTEGVKQ